MKNILVPETPGVRLQRQNHGAAPLSPGLSGAAVKEQHLLVLELLS